MNIPGLRMIKWGEQNDKKKETLFFPYEFLIWFVVGWVFVPPSWIMNRSEEKEL